MIVNPWSVTAASIDLLSGGLALATAGLSGFLMVSVPGDDTTGEIVTRHENNLYLAFWMGCVLLLVRFLAWPFFYMVLHSFVSEVQGTMCIFGVRNLLPRLTRFLEVLKPILFLLGLLWLVLFRLERTGNLSPQAARQGRRTMLALLGVCSVAAAVDSLGSLVLWLRSSAELAVSCCTTVTDIPSRFTVWIPLSLFGPGYEQPLLYGSILSTLLLLILVQLSRVRLRRSTVSAGILAVTSLAGVLNAVVIVLTTIEVVAPRLMRLPFHHCLYCMLQKVADAPLFSALFVVATCCICSAFPLWLLAHSWCTPERLRTTLATLLGTGLLTLAGSVVMIAVHLVLSTG